LKKIEEGMIKSVLKQPVGVKKFTNIAIIKIKKGKKRFEIACYKNKAINYRNGV
jgi:ribosome maturation protein SDO1